MKKPRHTLSGPSAPEVHVTIQNIAPDSKAASTFNAVITSHSHPQTQELTLIRELTPPPCSQPRNVVTPSPLDMLHTEEPKPSSTAMNTLQYPSIKQLLNLIHAEKPGKGFDEMEWGLLEAGLYTSDQVLLPPKDVLAFIGDMGLARARTLRNYARCLVLPILGLQRNYDEPEIDDFDQPMDKPTPLSGHSMKLPSNEVVDQQNDKRKNRKSNESVEDDEETVGDYEESIEKLEEIAGLNTW